MTTFVNLFLIGFRRPIFETLRLSAIWQTCDVGGFRLAPILNPTSTGAGDGHAPA